MKARVLTGSKREIADRIAEMDCDVREAIVFVEERVEENGRAGDIFAEMAPFTVRRAAVDDSREAVYRRAEGE